ncbi:MAG: hypothetical protein LKE48_03550 [Solobacterium sp.]|jgi:gas vesicle protein|nr:hypothetical protein [Solobacterium sp.]
MSDAEKKNTEEKDPIDFDDEKEPIDSIEKTVEDLKKKIQELSQEDEQKLQEEQKEEDPSAKEKISATLDHASKSISKGINDLKQKAGEVSSSEEMQKSIAYVKTNAVKVYGAAKDKIDQLKNDPNLQAAGNKAADSFNQFADTAKAKGQKMYDSLDEHTKEDLNNAYHKISGAVSEGVKSVDEFVNRPDVQQKISEVKEGAAELAQKSAQKVKDLIDSTKNGKQGN